MGALTSRPYAFQGRSWELKSIAAFDILDANCTPIRIDLRGTEVMRILPLITNHEDWITDKIRFTYDSFNLTRLTTPMFHLPEYEITRKKKFQRKTNWLTEFAYC